MNEWTESVKILVDILVASVIVTALLTVALLQDEVGRAIENSQLQTAVMQELRVANMYDGNECYAADVVSLVMECQGVPSVVIKGTNGTTTVAQWTKNNATTTYTTAAVSNKVSTLYKYSCAVQYDANGTLTMYEFKQVSV